MMQGKQAYDEAARRQDAADWWLRLHEETPPEALSEWLEWRARDLRNAAAFDDVQRLASRLNAVDRASADALVAEFGPTQQQDQAPKKAGLRGRIRAYGRDTSPWARAAAATVLLTLGAALWLVDRSGPAPEERSYATEIAVNREVVLVDGSKLVLGGASQATAVFDAQSRRIQLQAGQAYFEVVKDPQRPFVVEAGGITVRAVGTAFDVRTTGTQVAVTVTQGHVRVGASAAGGRDARTPSIDANADQQVIYDAEERTLTILAVDPEQALAWRAHRLEFDNERLDVVIANVNRYSRTPLRILDAELGEIRFTGTVLPPKLDDWLAALPQIFPLRVQRTPAEVLIGVPRIPAGERNGREKG